MKKIHYSCDRCGKELPYYIAGAKPFIPLDLCADCEKSYEEWMKCKS